ncbi:MAG TPA: hypothetical protein VK666_22605 [Chryseolinea sp.]|nr:hypothetical protein [Chryseolinea sp.]
MRYLLLLLSVASATTGLSQPNRPDTGFLDSARTIQLNEYNSLIGGNSRLYNGIQYKDYVPDNEEHPFFGVDDWSPGSVTYDDESYEDVNMFYDISQDKVITEHTPSGGKIEMISNKVDRFTINDHQFVHLREDKDGVIANAFYEVLFDGKVKLYARRQKQLQTKMELGHIVHYFSVANRVYIFKDGHYARVRTKKSVYAVLNDHRKEVAAALRANKIRFRRQREKAITIMLQEYDRQTS